MKLSKKKTSKKHDVTHYSIGNWRRKLGVNYYGHNEEEELMETRLAKGSDQEEAEKAFQILKEAMNAHPEIESTLWAGAMWSCLVEGYVKSGMSYASFCPEWRSVRKHYKPWFDQFVEEDKEEEDEMD